ncbi:hypothetical protein HYX11_01020 [Candidatus Woesearchaeota archaeon]|nr:hypothetical protein [Candidatus Woesearchaeota archaeon]
MVIQNKFYLVVGVVFVVFSMSLVLGLKDLAEDISLQFWCTTNEECKGYCSEEALLAPFNVKPEELNCVCDLTENSCYDNNLPPSWVTLVSQQLNEASSNQSTPVISSVVTDLNTKIDTKIKDIEQSQKQVEEGVVTLESKSKDLEQRVGTVENSYNDLSIQIEQLNTNVQTLNNMQIQASNELKNDVNTVAVGLATAQNDLQVTKENLSAVGQKLEEEKSSRQLLSYVFFGLLALAAALGAIYYVSGVKESSSKEERGASNEVVDYITKGLKSGKKYMHLKDNLMKVGWAAEEVENGFKQAVKQSFPRMVQQSPSVKVAVNAPRQVKTQPVNNKNKVMAIAGIIFIVLSVVLVVMFSQSSGQAIYTKQLVGGKEGGTAGEITYTVECTPPHILLPSKKGCCLDNDKNGACDYLEKEREKRRSTGRAEIAEKGDICIENTQCKNGMLCINSKCSTLDVLYKGTGDCSKVCNYYAIKILTSDKETYNVKPNEGSYTAAGAVEWIVLEAPIHCKGEPAVVPIEIIKKKPGEIISDEVITLSKGQSSNAITHPEISRLLFTLKVQEIHELCSE